MQNITNSLVTAVTFLVTIGPLIISMVKYIGVKTNSKQIITIADRAAIIVSALDNLDYENKAKQEIAISKLCHFAKELSIPLTHSQAIDYIEDAVRVMHETAYDKEKTTT